MTQSLNEAIVDFINGLRNERKLSERTVRAYLHDLDRFRRYLLSQETTLPTLSRITPTDLRNFLLFLQERGSLRSASVARKISTLRSFFRFLVEQGYLKENPSLRLQRTKLAKKLPVYLTRDELKRLLAAPDKEGWMQRRDRAMLVLLAMTGVRLDEMIRLNVGDLTFQNRTIRVLGKGNKERLIPLNGLAVAALQEYLDVRPYTEDPALFLNKFKRRLTGRSVEKKLAHYALKAGIKRGKISPHKLRHTFATLLHDEDVDILEIQRLLGHANISSTTIYTHTKMKRLKQAVDKLDQI